MNKKKKLVLIAIVVLVAVLVVYYIMTNKVGSTHPTITTSNPLTTSKPSTPVATVNTLITLGPATPGPTSNTITRPSTVITSEPIPVTTTRPSTVITSGPIPVTTTRPSTVITSGPISVTTRPSTTITSGPTPESTSIRLYQIIPQPFNILERIKEISISSGFTISNSINLIIKIEYTSPIYLNTIGVGIKIINNSSNNDTLTLSYSDLDSSYNFTAITSNQIIQIIPANSNQNYNLTMNIPNNFLSRKIHYISFTLPNMLSGLASITINEIIIGPTPVVTSGPIPVITTIPSSPVITTKSPILTTIPNIPIPTLQPVLLTPFPNPFDPINTTMFANSPKTHSILFDQTTKNVIIIRGDLFGQNTVTWSTVNNIPTSVDYSDIIFGLNSTKGNLLNLVNYKNGTIYWNNGITPGDGAKLIFENDGTLSVYNNINKKVWSSSGII